MFICCSSDLELSDFLIFPELLGLTEDVTCYKLQGYHPIKIGDVLGGVGNALGGAGSSTQSRYPCRSPAQYRIMHKLGFGGYATVWLAQRLDASRAFVALKITTGWGQGSKEADMMEAANACVDTANLRQEAANSREDAAYAGHDDPQSSHVLRLHDRFEVSGPNGTHAVLVTDVVVPLLSLKYASLSPRWRKVAAYGLVKALAHMHRADIVHGGTCCLDPDPSRETMHSSLVQTSISETLALPCLSLQNKIRIILCKNLVIPISRLSSPSTRPSRHRPFRPTS